MLAGIAAIGLLATVCPFVSFHVVLLDKTHVTLVTAERLLSTVDLLVPLEQVFLNEAHVTLAAPERPLTCAIKSTTNPLTTLINVQPVL